MQILNAIRLTYYLTDQALARTVRKIDNIEIRLQLLESLLSGMEREEMQGRVGAPVFESLISLYGSLGRFEKASQVYDKIRGETDVSCLRAILVACGVASPPRFEEAITYIHSSDVVVGSNGSGVDQVSLGNAIIACSKANEFEQALNLLQLYGNDAPPG